MTKIVMYTKEHCPYCDNAKAFLKSKNLAFTEIRVDLDSAKLGEMIALSGRRSVPQIFINNQAIGGFDDMVLLAKNGQFDQLLV
jgi:glutaredoxin 3